MTPEERLRTALRDAAVEVPPGGLSRITHQIAVRRARRRVVVPAVSLACAAGVAVAFTLIGGDGGRARLVQVLPPAASSAPTPAADDGRVTTSAPGQPIWPFATDEQAATFPAAKPWASTSRGAAQHFLTDYLGVRGVVLLPPRCVCDGLVLLSVRGREVGQMRLVQVGTAATRPWSVIGVTDGTALQVTAPATGAAVTSPLTVTGRVLGVGESIRVRLLSRAGAPLAQAYTPAGLDIPWSTTLRWTERRWPTGALVASTLSPRDGSLNRLLVIPIRRG